ncbi:unnamed protein product [Leptidea sinapis]|uniref:Peptidase S1 domain-containing protein n=1 Tax=Leptidea sinapis TaxID=189913 RepID=A0A5E4PTB8_9NEOP|nr:unnamed protein product [Leptidea sinapis]
MFCLIILLVTAIQVVHLADLNCHCGRPSDDTVSMRIVGGRRAEPHSYPWTVAILKNDRMHCGAAGQYTGHGGTSRS